MESVHFENVKVGWAVGAGVIRKTIDGGVNWLPQSSPINNDFHSVYFLDTNSGWIVGWYGTILRTTNGGTTWMLQASSTTRNLSSVRFANANVGWTVGDSGTILKTTNGGTSWITQVSGTIRNLKSVIYTDANNGWAVGSSGTILKTTNGGSQWTAQPSGTTKNLNSVYFVDVNNGWALGDSGAIVKYSSGVPILFQMSPLENHFGKFSYQLTSPSRISAIIYDLHGNRVAKLFDGNQQAGYHEFEVPRQMPSLENYILDFQTNGNHKAVRLQGR